MRYILAFCVVVALSSNSATAQTICSPREGMVGRLAEKYGEVPVALGVTNKGGLVEVLTTGDGDTWTIILSNPNGTSCLVAAGGGWKFLKPNYTKFDPQT